MSVGSINRARAKEMRIRQPPENILVGLVCISILNPNPYKIRRARASAASAPILVNSSTTCCNRATLASDSALSSSSSPSSASSAFINSSSSLMSSQRRTSARNTASTAGVSSATISCSTYKKSIRGGSFKSPEAIILSSVDFPFPLGPTNPYRRPCAMVSAASLNKIFPAALMEKLGIVMSSEFIHCGSFSSMAVCEQANWAPSREACAADSLY
mmetsp:Transcript_8453/g.18224  ORF Transcript_8453/g.18224 Transcript_8453/m.18224 type:complete len:215 (-) Transcript_8453:468-1112(-)